VTYAIEISSQVTVIAIRNNQIIISGEATRIKRVQTWLKCSSCVFQVNAFDRITKENNSNSRNNDERNGEKL